MRDLSLLRSLKLAQIEDLFRPMDHRDVVGEELQAQDGVEGYLLVRTVVLRDHDIQIRQAEGTEGQRSQMRLPGGELALERERLEESPGGGGNSPQPFPGAAQEDAPGRAGVQEEPDLLITDPRREGRVLVHRLERQPRGETGHAEHPEDLHGVQAASHQELAIEGVESHDVVLQDIPPQDAVDGVTERV